MESIGVNFMMIFSIALITLTIVVYFTFFKKEKSVTTQKVKPKKREIELDRLQKERIRKEIENFLNYNGDEQR